MILRTNNMTRLVVLVLACSSAVVAANMPGLYQARHAILSQQTKKRKQQQQQHDRKSTRRCRAPIGTFFTFCRPTTELVAQWFARVQKDVLNFNHDSVGMTNPCLHISLTDNQRTVLPVSSSTQESVSDAWFPSSCDEDSSWRVLRYRRRIGKGEACYNHVRDAALDWEFETTENKGILRVKCPSDDEDECHTRQEQSAGYDVVHNAFHSDGEFTLTNDVGRNVMQIWSGPHSGRRLVTYSAGNLGKRKSQEEKVRFSVPRLFAVNPVMVVYDLVDQRGPGTTYTSTALATLKGHLMSGEERVTVAHRDGAGDYVDVEILSYSRPAPSLLGKLVWPLIGPMQNSFFESQMDALEEVAKQAPPPTLKEQPYTQAKRVKTAPRKTRTNRQTRRTR